MLRVERLTRVFRGLVAVDAVSFGVGAGEIVAVIGPNGAGKTTLFSMIAGALKPTSGRIELDGTDVTGAAPERMAGMGLARTFQVVRPMRGLTVLENAMIGALGRGQSVEAARATALEALEQVGLKAKAGVSAKHLTLPDLKMLELARALSVEPRLLLLDEVMAGLRPLEADKVVAVLKGLRADGLTIVLIEHVMRVVMSLADRIVVLHHGERIAEGEPEAVTSDPEVIRSYLGSKASRA
jgi:branched-chain amino acid transport system ATP-binding protein